MENNAKYYVITLKNVFIENGKEFTHFGVFEHGKYYDLFTNKEIYMLDEGELYKDEFINSNCKLIGIKKEEVGKDKINIFLNFITESAKTILIDEVNNMEESIKNSLNNYELTSKNKVKRLEKYDFLRNY